MHLQAGVRRSGVAAAVSEATYCVRIIVVLDWWMHCQAKQCNGFRDVGALEKKGCYRRDAVEYLVDVFQDSMYKRQCGRCDGGCLVERCYSCDEQCRRIHLCHAYII